MPLRLLLVVLGAASVAGFIWRRATRSRGLPHPPSEHHAQAVAEADGRAVEVLEDVQAVSLVTTAAGFLVAMVAFGVSNSRTFVVVGFGAALLSALLWAICEAMKGFFE